MSIKAGNGSVGGNYLSQTYLSGSIILSQSYTESFSDGIGLVDSHTSTPMKVFADNIGLTELYNKLTNKNPFSDSIGIADTGSVSKVLLKVFIDSISAVDDFFTDYFQFFSRLFTDGIGMADTFSKKLDKLLALVDNISITEIVSKVLPHKRLTDQIQASDSLTFVQHLSMILTDTISAIDNIAKKIVTAFSDGIGAVDSGFIMPIKNFVESVSLSDSFVKSVIIILRSAISAIDNIGKKTVTAFSDGIGLVDSKVLTPIKVFVESISLSENIVKSVKIVLSSTIHIRDSIVRRLNGMLISWEKTAMDIADWTKTNKKEDTFSKTARNEEEWTKLKGEK